MCVFLNKVICKKVVSKGWCKESSIFLLFERSFDGFMKCGITFDLFAFISNLFISHQLCSSCSSCCRSASFSASRDRLFKVKDVVS